MLWQTPFARPVRGLRLGPPRHACLVSLSLSGHCLRSKPLRLEDLGVQSGTTPRAPIYHTQSRGPISPPYLSNLWGQQLLHYPRTFTGQKSTSKPRHLELISSPPPPTKSRPAIHPFSVHEGIRSGTPPTGAQTETESLLRRRNDGEIRFSREGCRSS